MRALRRSRFWRRDRDAFATSAWLALFQRGLHAAHEAGLPLALSMIVARRNVHETGQMRARRPARDPD